MKFSVIAAIIAGLACAIGVIAYLGAGAVFGALTVVGWGGFALLCAYSIVIYLPLGAAWRVLVGAEPHARLDVFARARLVRDAATELLPFSSIGGFVLGARAAMITGMSATTAFASSLVDLTTELFAQIAFILLGAGLWATRLTHSASESGITLALNVGLAIFIFGGLGFFVLQRRGLRLVTGFATRLMPGAEQNTEEFHAKLEAIYQKPVALFWSSLLHLVGWFASAVGVWISFHLIGVQADLSAVITLEALVCALRSSAFFVPSALGVQEVGYAFLAPLFGLPAEAGVAISLLKRAREVATGVIALALWQLVESRGLLRRVRAKDAAQG